MEYAAWVVSAVLACICYVWYRDNRGKNGASKPPPSPFSYPIIGNMMLMMTMDMKMFSQLQQTLGNIFLLKGFGVNMLYLSSYAAIKEVLVNQSDVFSQKFRARDSWLRNVHNYTILAMFGPVLTEKRKFTLQHLRNFGFGKSAMETIIMNEFAKLCIELDKYDGRKMEMKNFCAMSVFNVLWGVLGGRTFAYDDDTIKTVQMAINDIFTSATKSSVVMFYPVLKHLPGDKFSYKLFVKATETLQNFVQNEMDAHSRTLPNGEPRDYIDAYLMEINKRQETGSTKDNRCFTTEHLRGSTFDLILAGVGTTTSTLDWAMLYMAVWPEIQERVQRELDEVIGKNRKPQTSDMAVLPFVKATVMEIQRWASVIGLSSIRVASKTTTVLDYTITKGTLVMLNYYGIHRDKDAWGDPDVFRPERFITEDSKTFTPESWMPYSIGNRNCVGESLARMEVFLMFAALMQRYSFRCVKGEPLPSLDHVLGMSLEPEPFQLIVKQRAQLSKK